MAKETDGSPDFCLTCDRRNPGESNCSQACCPTNPEEWLSSSAPAGQTSSERGTCGPWSGIDEGRTFYLPPAINFEKYKSTGKKSPPLTYRSYFKALEVTSFSEPSGLLIEKASTPHDRLSDQAIEELRNYVGSFDQTRNWKRRVSTR